MQKKQIGPLEVVVQAGQQDAYHIILFHGYGANCYDLAPLARELNAPANANWYFPDAPLTIPIGPGMMGRAWFPIDGAALEAALATGTYRQLTEIRPEGLDRARELATEMLATLDIPPERLILGGFSQGAMLATDLVLHSDREPAALIILSGTLLDRLNWEKRANARHLRFFQSHGESDPLLDPAAALELNKILHGAGWENEFFRFGGGHEIPLPILHKLRDFLSSLP